MQDAQDSAHTPSTLAAREQPRDGSLPGAARGAAAVEGQFRGAFGLLRRLAGLHNRPVSYIQTGPLDEHTLNDIGISRVETLYCDPT